MKNMELSPRRQEALARLTLEFAEARGDLTRLGFVLQGSLSERWMLCGKIDCACKRWIGNNREMEKIVKRLRRISLRAARLFQIPPK